ncbi:LLM class flavin-dependent oxidoreductase [Dermacoccus sp. PAMC28757]|nr:LLM class flavin-dependent oxidoreductase [Dermacoccus sp. PAMC28757]
MPAPTPGVDPNVSDNGASHPTDPTTRASSSPDDTTIETVSFAKKAGDIPLSILDLAQVGGGQSVGDAINASVELAQAAEATGRFERIWFAEHHNMKHIASAATSVLLAHVAARTNTIRVGSGGVMLPNHSPLVIAEQFGTLAELHPGRIDLGLGRAPGTDQRTWQALRRDPHASDRFPQDVVELQGLLSDESPLAGIEAVPGQGTHVPLYILGSSMFGAKLAAALGLPYAFASHFAPDALQAAVHAYRTEFRPSEQLAEPHVIAALNVVAAETDDAAATMYEEVLRARVRSLATRFGAADRRLSDDEIEMLLDSPAGQQAKHMLTYTAIGGPERVGAYLEQFAEHAMADELMMTNAARGLEAQKRALEIVASIR